MNSFTLTAVGNLARNPEHVAKGEMTYTRFCLVGSDYAGKDEEGASREVVTSLWFVAFGPLGEAIARHSRKGDQLFVEARVRASNWTDKQGGKQYDHSFVVQGFRWGAPGKTKREERDGRRDEVLSLPKPEERLNGRDKNGGAADLSDSLDGTNGGAKAEGAPDSNIPPVVDGTAAPNGPALTNGSGNKSNHSRSSRKTTVPAA
jgi:single-strand DNA-binding protein